MAATNALQSPNMTLPLNVLWCSLFLQGMWRVVFVVDALRVERVARSNAREIC